MSSVGQTPSAGLTRNRNRPVPSSSSSLELEPQTEMTSQTSPPSQTQTGIRNLPSNGCPADGVYASCACRHIQVMNTQSGKGPILLQTDVRPAPYRNMDICVSFQVLHTLSGCVKYYSSDIISRSSDVIHDRHFLFSSQLILNLNYTESKNKSVELVFLSGGAAPSCGENRKRRGVPALIFFA